MATAFEITPHKVSVCILLHAYALPAPSTCIPYPFLTIPHHNRFGLFILALIKSHEDVSEPILNSLLEQLREVSGHLARLIVHHLVTRISSLSSPDDLFNFFSDVRGVLAASDYAAGDDNQVALDPNSCLGIFLRRCILAFNMLSFESVCHLLRSIEVYCKDARSFSDSEDLLDACDPENDLETHSQDNLATGFANYKETQPVRSIPFHLHCPMELNKFIEEAQMHHLKRMKHGKDDDNESGVTKRESSNELFIGTHLQLQSYLIEKAQALEKRRSKISIHSLNNILNKVKKHAPKLRQVHFLRYFCSLYHDDYFSALRDLHCYFDRSSSSSGASALGGYATALLCLGMMHLYFGHPKHSLEVLVEAVRFSQLQNDDSCLAYSLAVICNLLSENGCASLPGLLRSSYSPHMDTSCSFSAEQQLFVLLSESLKRAEALKLQCLIASNHLAMAKFHLMHVQRPMLSFGPNASMKIETCPVDVCKELRSCRQLLREFSLEGSTMTVEGYFSNKWLKNLSKPVRSILQAQDYNDQDTSHYDSFFLQPSSVPDSVLNLVGSSYLLRASTWELYGSSSLSRISSLVYATCYAHASSAYDASLVHAKLIQHLAVFRGYNEAFAALKIAETKFFSVSKSVVLLVKLQLLHEWALHRGDAKLAQRVCDELRMLVSPVAGVDMKLKAEAMLRRCRTLLLVNQFTEAAAAAHSLYFTCHKYNMQVENASVLLLLAEIHKKSGNPVMALPYALASISFSQSLNLDIVKASAMITLSEIFLLMGPAHAPKALSLVHDVLPIVLGHGGLELCARARLSEAKCRLSFPDFPLFDDFEEVLGPLRTAARELQVLEYHELAAEVFYLMAMTFHKLGKEEEREDAATSFKNHLLALETPSHLDDYPYLK